MADLPPHVAPGEVLPPTWGTPSEQDRPPSILARFGRLFTAPQKAFVPPRTRALWLVPLVVLSLVQVTEALLLQDLYKQKMVQNLSQNEKIPEEQRAKIVEQMQGSTNGNARIILGQVAGVASSVAIAYLLPALLYLLGLNFVMGGAAKFREVFTVVVFSNLVSLPREIIRLPLMLAKGSVDIYTSPAAFIASGGKALTFALNLFDVFELYRLFLLMAGFAVITALPLRKTAFPVILVWVLYGLLGVGCMLSPIGQFMP
jgi:hypothetical protein